MCGGVQTLYVVMGGYVLFTSFTQWNRIGSDVHEKYWQILIGSFAINECHICIPHSFSNRLTVHKTVTCNLDEPGDNWMGLTCPGPPFAMQLW